MGIGQIYIKTDHPLWRNLSVVGEKHGKVNTRQGNKFCHMKACYKRL